MYFIATYVRFSNIIAVIDDKDLQVDPPSLKVVVRAPQGIYMLQ